MHNLLNNIHGLKSSEVELLQKKFGRNDVEEKYDSWPKRLLKKFYGPIPIMIEIALLLSAIVKKWEDFIIISTLLGVNILIDFLQEHKAYTALQNIKKTLSPTATVLRNDKFETIDARDLVPGDIVKISPGNMAPADAEIIDNTILFVDRSSITGESSLIELKTGDLIQASSIIQKGSGIIKITAIGENSAIGKNLKLIKKAEQEQTSHFQKAIINISHFLIVISTILATIIFIVLMSRGDTFIEVMHFVLVLIIASIPVALPAVLSVTMAIGANNLFKKNAIVSNFKAIEELAGVDRLCLDKTGTLTKNEMSISKPKTYGQFTMQQLFAYALLASDDGHKTPIEKAIYTYALENKFTEKVKEYIIKKFTIFNPYTKITTSIINHPTEGSSTITMGATQVIGDSLTNDSLKLELQNDVKRFSNDGFKSIAITKQTGNIIELVGILTFIDPPREGVTEVLNAIKKDGIIIKMITGDNTTISLYIAKILNMGTRIIESKALQKIYKTKKTQDDVKLINHTDIFAEVTPEDKYNIIKTLQEYHHIVAMTGDGVNDTPALTKADVGFAVSGASEAARAAADIILLDDGLSVIRQAIKQARITFSQMQSYATFRIAETIRILFFISFSILLLNYSPITAVMIIILALLNDIPIMAIAYDNVLESKKPIRWQLQKTLIIASILGLMGLISSFSLLYFLSVKGVAIAVIQTIVFIKLDVSGHSTLYLTRTGRRHFWERPYPSLKFFIPVFSTRIVGTLLAFYGVFMAPVSITTIIFIWIYSTVWFFINDYIKVSSYKMIDKLFKKRKILNKSYPILHKA